MSDLEMAFIPHVNKATPGKNHVLSRNPLTTRCGVFKPGGHEPARADADMCQKCLNLTIGRRIEGAARPLPDKLKGNRQ